MLLTWIYAVWMMSTQATALMVPIADAFVKQYAASFEEAPAATILSEKAEVARIERGHENKYAPHAARVVPVSLICEFNVLFFIN